jgi:hypothetical protein
MKYHFRVLPWNLPQASLSHGMSFIVPILYVGHYYDCKGWRVLSCIWISTLVVCPCPLPPPLPLAYPISTDRMNLKVDLCNAKPLNHFLDDRSLAVTSQTMSYNLTVSTDKFNWPEVSTNCPTLFWKGHTTRNVDLMTLLWLYMKKILRYEILIYRMVTSLSDFIWN